MLFPQENSFAALSCINFSSSPICNFYIGFYVQIISPQNVLLQNKAVRIGCPDKMEFHGKRFIYQPKGLKTEQHYQYGAGKMMYNLYHKQHPRNLNQYFTKSNVRHSRPTRSSTSLLLTIP